MEPFKGRPRKNYGYKTANNTWIEKMDVLENMGICERTLQGWRSNGTIPHSPIGGRIYYRESDLEAILEKNLRTDIRKKKIQDPGTQTPSLSESQDPSPAE